MPVLSSMKAALGRLKTTGATAGLSIALLMISTAALQPGSREYQVKAVFLFNFTQFVEWPEKAFESANAPLVIGVMGEDPFGSYLDETVRGEVIHGHPLTVERYNSVSEIDKCHILFIATSDRQSVERALEGVAQRPVLTVGDSEDFARMGGVIGFFQERGRIRFSVNVGAASDAGLTISSKLLRLAEIIPGKRN